MVFQPIATGAGWAAACAVFYLALIAALTCVALFSGHYERRKAAERLLRLLWRRRR